MTDGTGVPAGWFQDPVDAGAMRWWDGSGWTGHTFRPPAAQAVAQTVLPAGPTFVSGYPGQVPGATAYHGGYANPTFGGRTAAPDPVLTWLVPVGRTGLSITAGYVGLVALLCFYLAPAALVVGLLALRGLRGSPLGGRGRAWFAVVVGALGTVGLAALVVAHTMG